MQTYENYRTSIPQGHEKTEKWESQAKRILDALTSKPMTRLQVAHATSTPLQNVCRRVSEFLKAGRLCVVKKDIDPLSEMHAEYLSADQRICRPCQAGVQINLFN